MPSVTQIEPNLVRVGPQLEVHVAQSSNFLKTVPGAKQHTVQIRALIDTGAQGTCIEPGVIAQLGVSPVSTIQILTPSTGSQPHTCDCFEVDLFINQIRITNLMVAEAPLQGQSIQALIGRDVLRLGVFIYNGYTNMFTLSF